MQKYKIDAMLYDLVFIMLEQFLQIINLDAILLIPRFFNSP